MVLLESGLHLHEGLLARALAVLLLLDPVEGQRLGASRDRLVREQRLVVRRVVLDVPGA